MCDALGIINFENKSVQVSGLSKYRPIPSISFLGRFRLIDFTMSNMSNSGVSNIHIHARSKPRSIFSHVGTGRHYNINSKKGRVSVMYGEAEIQSEIYNTDINSFVQNMEHIVDTPEPYVIITPSYFVYTINYNEFLNYHIESKADVTILYKATDEAKGKYIECDSLVLSQEKRIMQMQKNRGRFKNRFISLECYVMRKDIFLNLIERAQKTSSLYWLSDILADMVNSLSVYGYPYRREVIAINSLKQYYQSHMDLTDVNYAQNFFNDDWPIFTRTNDSPPTHYGENSKVKKSSIANGSRINGTVENCFIGRNVTIEKGAVVRNSVILPGAYIGENALLDHVVVDKTARVEIVKELLGSDDNIIYVHRRDRI